MKNNYLYFKPFEKKILGDLLSNEFFSPKIEKEGDEYFIEYEIPGVNKEQIKISLEKDVLYVEFEKKGKKVSFSDPLPVDKFDPKTFKASLDKGILRISFKEFLKQENNPKLIEIS